MTLRRPSTKSHRYNVSILYSDTILKFKLTIFHRAPNQLPTLFPCARVKTWCTIKTICTVYMYTACEWECEVYFVHSIYVTHYILLHGLNLDHTNLLHTFPLAQKGITHAHFCFVMYMHMYIHARWLSSFGMILRPLNQLVGYVPGPSMTWKVLSL